MADTDIQQQATQIVMARLAEAEALAGTFMTTRATINHAAPSAFLGERKRKTAGAGFDFWEFRQAHEGDDATMIDPRSSARSDEDFVRLKEQVVPQSCYIWIDPTPRMDISTNDKLQSPRDCAEIIALAAAKILMHQGERVTLLGANRNPTIKMDPLAEYLVLRQMQRMQAEEGHNAAANGDTAEVTSQNDKRVLAELEQSAAAIKKHGKILLVSDFLRNPDFMEKTVSALAATEATGQLLQVLDPSVLSFDFGSGNGRTILSASTSGGTITHETHSVKGLRALYNSRFTDQQASIDDMARKNGWTVSRFITNEPKRNAILGLYGHNPSAQYDQAMGAGKLAL